MRDDLMDVQVGEEVIVMYGWSPARVAVVTHVTGTRFEADNKRFRKADGRGVGDHGYHGATAMRGTPERIAEVRAKQEARDIANRLEDVKWHKLPLNTLRAVADALDAASRPSVDPERDRT